MQPAAQCSLQQSLGVGPLHLLEHCCAQFSFVTGNDINTIQSSDLWRVLTLHHQYWSHNKIKSIIFSKNRFGKKALKSSKLTLLTVLRTRCPAWAIEATWVTFLTCRNRKGHYLTVHKEVITTALIIIHTLSAACCWKLHDKFGVSVDNIIPLYCFNIAQQLAWDFYASLENL